MKLKNSANNKFNYLDLASQLFVTMVLLLCSVLMIEINNTEYLESWRLAASEMDCSELFVYSAALVSFFNYYLSYAASFYRKKSSMRKVLIPIFKIVNIGAKLIVHLYRLLAVLTFGTLCFSIAHPEVMGRSEINVVLFLAGIAWICGVTFFEFLNKQANTFQTT